MIMVTPLWKTGAWWDTLQGMAREGPVKLSNTKDTCGKHGEQIPRLRWLVATVVQGSA